GDVRSDMREVASYDLLLKEAADLSLTPAFIDYPDPLFRREPQSRFVPAHWRYEQMKALLDAAGRLIDVSLATRRNFIMRNPIAGNNFATTNTMTCAYQMMMP